jgi:hypothetical protein
MLDELNTVLTDFQKKWQKLLDSCDNKDFFETLRPTAVAWKTEDAADFDARFAELRDHADHVHMGWINERWLATFHLRDATLFNGLTVIKLMQRRPGSSDAAGLDHVDFLIQPEGVSAKETLGHESGLEWTEEFNGDHCKWISIWFDGTEAKLRSDTTLDVCIKELQAVRDQTLTKDREA